MIVLASTLLEAALLYSPWSDPSRIYYGTDTRLATPLLGALLAIVLPAVAAGGRYDRPAGPRRTLDRGRRGRAARARRRLCDRSPTRARGSTAAGSW